MEDFGDYIYLILIVLAVLSGLLKKKKKDRADSVPQSPPVSDIEEEIREFWESEQSDYFPSPEVVEIEPIVVNEPFYKTFDNTADVSQMRVKKTVQSKTILEEQSKPEELVIELETAEQARAAFIYSEIFTRKY